MASMLVEFEFRGDICMLRLHGRFATGQDSLYLHTKAEELKNSGYVKILVDFSNVDYIDSTGIGFLIGIYTSVTKSPSGKFALAGTNRRVREVLELTRLAQVIPIYPNEAAALQELGAGSTTSASQAS
jgi:stage II sporulation protein AA (anti-sigma F factor antagonist)